MRVRMLDTAAQFESIREEIQGAVERVLASGQWIGGPEVQGLEEEIAMAAGCKQKVETKAAAPAEPPAAAAVAQPAAPAEAPAPAAPAAAAVEAAPAVVEKPAEAPAAPAEAKPAEAAKP